jgi:hypothetical protein
MWDPLGRRWVAKNTDRSEFIRHYSNKTYLLQAECNLALLPITGRLARNGPQNLEAFPVHFAA